MPEVIVIVESRADAEIATKLAERILVENVDWVEPDLLPNLFQWSGLEPASKYSCWKEMDRILPKAKESGRSKKDGSRYLGHGKTGPLKADGAATLKVLNFIQLLQRNRSIRAVLFIRDLDHERKRRQGMEQARTEHLDRKPQLAIIIGTADRRREAWVLNGFEPSSPKENHLLTKIKAELTFDPCEEAHRLRSDSFEEPDRRRNPKVVLDMLTGGDWQREQQCWEETKLDLLRERGTATGLTAYLDELKERLMPALLE